MNNDTAYGIGQQADFASPKPRSNRGLWWRWPAAHDVVIPSYHCLSYTAKFVKLPPCVSVPWVVTMLDFPSNDTTIRPVTVTFPFFLTVTSNALSSASLLYDRMSEFGSPVTG